MNGWGSVFWVVILAIIFYFGFKVAPIYYRGLFVMKGICKENVDVYHKYGREYVSTGLAENLDRAGITKDKRQYTISKSDGMVYVWIYYEDSATFFDRYTKHFEFEHECEGVLKSVYQ